jgi:hypothetical protein
MADASPLAAKVLPHRAGVSGIRGVYVPFSTAARL